MLQGVHIFQKGKSADNVTQADRNGAITILRTVLGIIFFAHGAQEMLGWFGGYGFVGTMAYFTGNAHSGDLCLSGDRG